MSKSIESLEIIDVQIHEPWPGKPLDEEMKPQTALWQVELAREAMDAIGVDIAFAVTSEAFYNLGHERFPGRFPACTPSSRSPPTPAAEVRRVRANPAVVAGRALVGDFVTR